MLNAIEGTVMVNPINDSQGFKQLDSEITIRNTKSKPSEDTPLTSSSVNQNDFTVQISALTEFVKSADAINQARVDFIKAQIANGKYSISSQDIALKMITQTA